MEKIKERFIVSSGKRVSIVLKGNTVGTEWFMDNESSIDRILEDNGYPTDGYLDAYIDEHEESLNFVFPVGFKTMSEGECKLPLLNIGNFVSPSEDEVNTLNNYNKYGHIIYTTDSVLEIYMVKRVNSENCIEYGLKALVEDTEPLIIEVNVDDEEDDKGIENDYPVYVPKVKNKDTESDI